MNDYNCKLCGKFFQAQPSNKRVFCSHLCANRTNDTIFKVGHEQSNTGRTHFKMQKNIGYMGLHMWMRRTYGRANKCENKDCLGKSKTYNWANKSLKYMRKRSDWMELCRSCHIKYDLKKGWGVASKKFNLHK